MKKVYFLCIAAVMSLSVQVAAQKVKVKEGSLAPLGAVTKLNVSYDYSDMAVGKYEAEGEYVQKKKGDYNKDEPGKGDKWEKAWIADREERFQPQFEELFNKHNNGLQIGDYPQEKYTLILKTTFTEPGFNVHVMRKNAMINAEAWIVESSHPENVIVKIVIAKSPGRTFGGYDYDSGTRIQEAYAAAGKALAKYLSKELK